MGTPAVIEKADFGVLRQKTNFILQKLLEDGQGYKNFNLDTKPMGRLFSQVEVEKMVGRRRPTLDKYRAKIEKRMTEFEKLVANGEIVSGGLVPEEFNKVLNSALPALEINDQTGRIKGYPFSWIQAFRAEAGTLPWRNPASEEAFILAVSQFKGGVGKTEITANYARYLALKGYRVLVIDMDHQGSCTGSFGVFPDMTFSEADTVIPYIRGDEETLDYAVKKTAWPNIDLIPGCMALEEFNWTLAQAAMESSGGEETKDLYYELKRGIDTISENYDIILIDSPPSSSISSFEIIAAADGIVIPIPPRKHDLASTEQYLGIVERLCGTIEEENDDGEVEIKEGILADKDHKFIRFLVTQFTNEKPRSTNDTDFYNICRGIYGPLCYEKVFRQISNIKEAAREFTTVYEVEKPNKAILKELDAMFEQIEIDILRHWPSKQEQLIEAGYVVMEGENDE